MGSALYTAVTGLQAHQRSLDVVAANIANVNTTGYRSARVLFQDLFSQTIKGGSAAVGSSGGTNSQQIGLGVQVSSIDINYGQGSLTTTDVSSDMAIEGNGFFVLSNGQTTMYTRDGSFTLNSEGLLIDSSTGMYVQGYVADTQGTIDTNSAIQNLSIPIGGTGISRETTTATLTGNLNASAETGTVVTRDVEFYDSLGTSQTVTLTFTKQATPANSWSWEASYDSPSAGVTTVGSGTLAFGADGSLATGTTGTVSIAGSILANNGSQPGTMNVTLDLDAVTQLTDSSGSSSDLTLQSQDGFERGVLQSFNIGSGGTINGVFSNGLTRVIGQVALAGFSNVGGLVRDGNNTFLETPASGNAQIGTPETGGRGSVSGGVLESSNVDLSQEFSNLIITQRGYQANARTITAADTLLQETVNLIR